MVYLERKRLLERDAAEAAGVDLWTEVLSDEVRAKLIYIWRACAAGDAGTSGLIRFVTTMIGHQLGMLSPPDMEEALLDSDTDYVLSYLDAGYAALEHFHELTKYSAPQQYRPEVFANLVAKVFESYRIKFKFVGGQIVPLGSEIMHAHVVEPTLVLLHGKSEFAQAEKAFRDALEELTGGKPDDAITDAGTALQETLIAVGCKGNTLGELIKDAKNKGWFGQRDSPLADSIAKIHNWVAAERNAGEAHRVSDVTKDDAWFVVHVVGAAIVRLAAGPRG